MSNIKYIRVLCAVALFTVLSSNVVMAQTVLGTADSSRVQKRITLDHLPKITGESPVKVPEHMITSAPKGADKQHLTLIEITIDGMSAYSEDQLLPMYQDLLGQKITLADVFGLAERLTIKYRNDGYILSQVIVPPQEIDNGKVRLQVIEGFIDQINIDGDASSRSKDVVYKMAQKIAKKRPLNASDLERYLLLMNDIPGFTVTSVLSPSTTQPGAADIDLFVEQNPYEITSQIDNRGSRYLGPLQATVAGRLNSFFGRGDSIDVQIATAPDGQPSRELNFMSLDYTETITKEGTKLNIGTSYTETEPGFRLSTFDIIGTSRNWHVELTHPLIRARSKNLFLSAKLDINNIKRTDNLPTRIEDRVRVLRLGGVYQFTDRFIGVNTIDITASQGLNLFNPRKTGSANLTRARGVHDFTKVEAEVSRLQHITNKVSLLGALSGQKSANNLLSSEEFGIGGASYGRGYDGSEIVGEDGLAGKLELQITDPVIAPVISGYQVYGFFDLGRVWDRDNTVSQNKIRSIASTGMGVRFDLNDNFSGSAEVAVPLTRRVEVTDDKDPRGFFSLLAKF